MVQLKLFISESKQPTDPTDQRPKNQQKVLREAPGGPTGPEFPGDPFGPKSERFKIKNYSSLLPDMHVSTGMKLKTDFI